MKRIFSNDYEELTARTIFEFIPNLAPPIDKLVGGDQIAVYNIVYNNLLNGLNTIGFNVKTPNLTFKDNEKKVEIMLKLINILNPIYIDAKHLEKTDDIVDKLSGDIKRAKNLNGVLWLVLYGEGYTDRVIEYLMDEKHDKVMFIKGTEGLINELKRAINLPYCLQYF